MAENLLALTEVYPNAKILAWAHNWHISRVSHTAAPTLDGKLKPMGAYIGDVLGNDYHALALAFHSGSYRGWDSRYNQDGKKSVIRPCNALEPRPGSFEHALEQLRLSQGFSGPTYLELPDKSKEGSPWPDGVQMNSVGAETAASYDREFGQANPVEQYDSLIFIPRSSPTRILSGFNSID